MGRLRAYKKVVDPGGKRRSAEKLVELMANADGSRKVISAEFKALTEVGNRFQIRNHETKSHPVEPVMIDILLVRGLALVESAVRSIVALDTTQLGSALRPVCTSHR